MVDDDMGERVYQHAAGRASGGHARARSGQDIEGEITVSLADVYHAHSRHVELETVDRAGKRSKRAFDVRLPPGLIDGATIRLTGQGESGTGGGTSGDVLLKVRIAPDERFRIDPSNGRDLLTTLNVSPWEAALGAKVPLRVMDGEVTVTVPAGSQSGWWAAPYHQGDYALLAFCWDERGLHPMGEVALVAEVDGQHVLKLGTCQYEFFWPTTIRWCAKACACF